MVNMYSFSYINPGKWRRVGGGGVEMGLLAFFNLFLYRTISLIHFSVGSWSNILSVRINRNIRENKIYIILLFILFNNRWHTEIDIKYDLYLVKFIKIVFFSFKYMWEYRKFTKTFCDSSLHKTVVGDYINILKATYD